MVNMSAVNQSIPNAQGISSRPGYDQNGDQIVPGSFQ